ncbi:NfeD-like family protein 2 [Glycocaulis alkaliphilus]|uniref:NfeD-like family protein 2 n=1 Tax=Glycocaulis alkaliphilus TaxID=1434191 RepID=A0A3T0ECN2_9PROT|nr:NfeD-like family protein 2 [Glycocaulis alkaliphilus]
MLRLSSAKLLLTPVRLLCAGLIALGAVMLAAGALARQAESANGTVHLVSLQGAIGPARAGHVVRAIERAASEADAVIIEMDTPGGLVDAMRDINNAILASPVPVIVHVAPTGARATSAGAYILYAAHVAAMAPGSTVGAATPVTMGGAPGSPPQTPDEGEEESNEPGSALEEAARQRSEPATRQAPGNDEAMRNKMVNDSVAYIRALAELRGRNGDWAERAVREGVSLTYSEAVNENVADFVAGSTSELLTLASGRTVMLGDGSEITLALEGAAVERAEMSLPTQILTVITDPNIAFLVLNLGFIGLLVSFYNGLEPITFVAGLICIIVGLYALNTLPLNYAGAALIVLGLGLLIAEVFVASYGLLALGGVIAFAIGALMLVDTDVEGLRIDWPMVLVMSAIMGVSVLLAGSYGLAAQARKVVTGREGLTGATGTVLSWLNGAGHVQVEGERWQAVSSEDLQPGDTVKVVSVDGLTVKVKSSGRG